MLYFMMVKNEKELIANNFDKNIDSTKGMRTIKYPYYLYAKQKTLKEKTVLADQYQIIHYIDHGAFGSVFKANDLLNNRIVAVKVIDIQSLIERKKNDPSFAKLIELSSNEPLNLMKINSNYVAKFYDGFENQEKNLKFLVMEYCQGPTLRKYICGLKKDGLLLKDEEAFEIFFDIARGIEELHRNNMMHRDLHSGNIMKNGSQWVIVDLGFSKVVRQRALIQKQTFLGSCLIRAPEMIAQSKYGLKVDVWALGLTLFYMLTTRYLFTERQFQQKRKQKILQYIQKKLEIEFANQQKKEISQKMQSESSQMLSDFRISEKMKQLIGSILKFHSKDRMTINQLFHHQIFKEFAQKIQPKKKTEQARLGSTEIISESPLETTFEEQCAQLLKQK